MPTLPVKGMRCGHCSKSVGEAVSKLPGTTDVQVDLENGTVTWTDADPSAPVSLDAVKKAVADIGFDAN